jgi:hypothetical protein
MDHADAAGLPLIALRLPIALGQDGSSDGLESAAYGGH